MTNADHDEYKQSHDFGDGHGPVPAHRHVLGGGWVADSATVHPSAHIDESAQVGERAQVGAGAQVSGSAKIGAGAWVGDRAQIGYRAQIGVEAQIGDWMSIASLMEVGDRSLVETLADILWFGPLVPRFDGLTITRRPTLIVVTGGWSGSLNAFEADINRLYGNTRYGQVYRETIAHARDWAARMGKD